MSCDTYGDKHWIAIHVRSHTTCSHTRLHYCTNWICIQFPVKARDDLESIPGSASHSAVEIIISMAGLFAGVAGFQIPPRTT